jgi:acetyl-CoA acetyltransferase
MRHDDVPLGVLAAEACRAAIADAGLDTSQIDGVACVPDQPFAVDGPTYDGADFVTCQSVIRTLKLDVRWGENFGGMVGRSVAAALSAVESGVCKYALVFRAMHSPSGSYGHTSTAAAAGPAQFELPYGVFYPSVFAQLWHRYRDKYRVGSREQMAALVIQERSNGLLWEHSYWSQCHAQEITIADYLDARQVSTPLSILDCDIPIQACGAFVITSAERAAHLRHRPAYVRGISAATFGRPDDVVSFTLEHEMACGQKIAADLWCHSGVRPADVSVANLYDGFSILAILWLEALGFCEAGEAFDFIQDGRIAPDGALPLNTAGGSLGAGRTHGVAHLMDSVLQVMGRSGPRQVRHVELALATIGPLSRSTAILLAPTAAP